MLKLKNIISDKYLFAIILTIGILLRFVILFRNNLMYGDEIALFENIKTLSFSHLFRGLDNIQACPPAFLFLSKLMLISPTHSYKQDLLLRIFPFIFGTASVFCFWRLCKLVIKDSVVRMLAFLVFTLNTQTIAYCTIFKQYSMELLVAIILYIIAYRIIFENTSKWWYFLLIALSAWFSYSCYFILAPLLIFLLLKNRTVFLKTVIPLIISFATFYSISLRYIISSSYLQMQDCWNGLDFGYLSFSHPLRLFIRTGEFFFWGGTTPYKILTILCGIFIVFLFITYLFSKHDKKLKLYLTTPILLVILASCLHKYPIVARLVLFTYPLLAIILVSYNYKFKKIILTSICFLAITSAIYYTPYSFDKPRNSIEIQKGYMNITQDY